jgi:hypothetical protein
MIKIEFDYYGKVFVGNLIKIEDYHATIYFDEFKGENNIVKEFHVNNIKINNMFDEKSVVCCICHASILTKIKSLSEDAMPLCNLHVCDECAKNINKMGGSDWRFKKNLPKE